MSNENTATIEGNTNDILAQVGLTADDLRAFKEEQAAKKVQKQRQELLKEYLEKDPNSEVYQELYKNHGLKEMVESDPTLLDNKTLFLRAAGLAKKEWEKARKQEEEDAKKEGDAQVKPPEDIKGTPVTGEQKEFDRSSLDVFHPEHLENLPKNSAQYHFFKMNAPKPTEKWR